MELGEIQEIFSKIGVSFTHPSFYKRIFTAVFKQQKKQKKQLLNNCKEEYDDLSKRAVRSGIQDDGSIRNTLTARTLANLLVDDKGNILVEKLPDLIKCLSSHLYSLGPNRDFESKSQEHLLHAIKQLYENKQILILLKNVSKPYSNKIAEDIIQDTLALPSAIVLTDAHARRSALSAYFSFLRQSVGSCFATAPSIIIHDEQPVQFLKDIVEMLGTGRLKRTYGGIEYAVPLSTTWGRGDLGRMVVIPKGLPIEDLDIGLSPGLIAAFEAVKLVPQEVSLIEKVAKTRQIIFDVVSNPDFSSWTTVDQLIQAILLKHLGLTGKDISDYQQRFLGMTSSLLVMTSGSTTLSKDRLCEQYETLLERAQNAFKGMADNALLKSWEFTLASFAENKAGFTSWNLYSSLGFNQDEQGGIGQKLYEIAVRKIEEANQKVKDYQFEYEQAYNQLKYLETRMRTTSTEKELEWLKIEYQNRRSEFYSIESMRDRLNARAQRYANLFNTLVDIYMQLFPQHFQEVYDADMHEVETGPYDDSPAGFRLLYKHGRGNTAQWTRIYNAEQYVNSLVGFFTSTEVEIRHSAEAEGLEDDFSEIVTGIVTHIRTPEFLETSFRRMATAHKTRYVKNSVDNLDKVAAKPWAYISGGSMKTLISAYYRREQKPTEAARWVESPMELLVFIADTLKHIPQKIMEPYVKQPNRSMLMFSPTHAFLLKPGFSQLKRSWQNQAFTYTWVRDELVKPRERFIDLITLFPEDMHFLIQSFVKDLPENYRIQFKNTFSSFYGTMKVPEFRNYLLSEISRNNGLQSQGTGILSADDIDTKLFEELPLFPADQLKERVQSIFAELPDGIKLLNSSFDGVMNLIMKDVIGNERLSAKHLQSVCKVIILLLTGATSFPHDYHRLIAGAAQRLGYAMPEPIVFADTNWVKNLFAFVVNPGTGKLELWRVDCNGATGSPMSSWNHWLDGSRRDCEWGIYTRPFEYDSN